MEPPRRSRTTTWSVSTIDPGLTAGFRAPPELAQNLVAVAALMVLILAGLAGPAAALISASAAILKLSFCKAPERGISERAAAAARFTKGSGWPKL